MYLYNYLFKIFKKKKLIYISINIFVYTLFIYLLYHNLIKIYCNEFHIIYNIIKTFKIKRNIIFH